MKPAPTIFLLSNILIKSIAASAVPPVGANHL